MTVRRFTTVSITAAALFGIVLAGCGGSKRTTISGYSDEMLNAKRIALVLPDAADVKLNDATAYASARGAMGESATEQLASDFRIYLTASLAARLDSNTLINYRDNPAGAMVPLNATTNFSSTGPASWEVVKNAAHQGNFDFMLVLRSMSVSGTSAMTSRGSETINAEYLLLDVNAGKVMTSGQVTASVKQISGPSDSYVLLAEKLTDHMPFVATDPKGPVTVH